jgi:hypothetical protein
MSGGEFTLIGGFWTGASSGGGCTRDPAWVCDGDVDGNGAGMDHLGGGVAVRGPVHLVLHGLEEKGGRLRGGVVIDARGVDVEYLAPEDLLRRADFADASQQFIEVVPPPACLRR